MQIARLIVILSFFLPGLLLAQNKFSKTWEDTALKSNYILRTVFEGDQKSYLFEGELYQTEGKLGKLAEGSLDRIRQVVDKMDEAFLSKDPEKVFALGRYKYTYGQIELNDLFAVNVLKVEDLLKNDEGTISTYMMSGTTLSRIKEFVSQLE